MDEKIFDLQDKRLSHIEAVTAEQGKSVATVTKAVENLERTVDRLGTEIRTDIRRVEDSRKADVQALRHEFKDNLTTFGAKVDLMVEAVKGLDSNITNKVWKILGSLVGILTLVGGGVAWIVHTVDMNNIENGRYERDK